MGLAIPVLKRTLYIVYILVQNSLNKEQCVMLVGISGLSRLVTAEKQSYIRTLIVFRGLTALKGTAIVWFHRPVRVKEVEVSRNMFLRMFSFHNFRLVKV
jgi:hypothetical protein